METACQLVGVCCNMYEYKLFPAPRQVSLGKTMTNEPTEFTATIAGQINLISGGGWEFMRTLSLPFLRRNWLRRTVTRYEPVLIFRRSLAQSVPEEMDAMVSDFPQRVRPKRVRPARKPGARMNMVSRKMRASTATAAE